MNNKKLLTLATVAGLTFGGLSIGAVASAQGNDTEAPSAEIVVEAESPGLDGLALIQEVGEPEQEGTDGEVRRHRGGCDLDEAADAIGISEDELRSALESGSTIADVAEANGVDVDAVIDAMVQAKTDRLATKVAEGRITQDEADAKLAETESRITDRVNGTEDGDQV